MIEIIDEPLNGVFLLQPKIFNDQRGNFIKTFQKNDFHSIGIDFEPVEEFFSGSHKNVIRGLHFQLPPNAHDKLVYCIRGKILDVIIDLRKSSDTYGKAVSIELSDINKYLLLIPKGFGHGFLSLEDESMMVYKTSTVHSPESDFGIRWNSIDFTWQVENPIISSRDNDFIDLKDFKSPF